VLVNDSERAARIMVIASFHDADHRPMTRPFTMVPLGAHVRQDVQLVGPPGSKHGTIFVGEVVYCGMFSFPCPAPAAASAD
jgi:hypothetical protein